MKGICKKCGIEVHFNIRDLEPEEVKERLEKMDIGYECPGMHVELSRIIDGYDIDFSKVLEREEPPSDEEYVKSLHEKGYTVIDGGLKTVTGLKSIHDYKDLKHIGFGNFESDTHIYRRADSPRGTRFYIEVRKEKDSKVE